MKTGRVAAVAEEARRRWQAEGLAPADAFWVRNRRNTGLVLVSPNADPDAPPPEEFLSGEGGGRTVSQAGIDFHPAAQVVQARPNPPPTQPAHTAGTLFRTYRQNLSRWEGGIANRPASVDPGGITNQGISKDFLDELRKLPKYRNLPSDPRRLSDAQIDAIYRAENFDRPQIWKLAQVPGLLVNAPQLVEHIFDAGVQHGIDDSGKWLQEALDETLGTDLKTLVKGKRGYDGIIGSGTRKVVDQAVKAGKIAEVNNLIVDKRIAYMKSLPNYSGNPGWITRAESFRIGSPNP
ncbi:glycosyl hydrolase 108 family protein [Pelagibius sp.]|uniref:glycosyl hydrolase 108 family protein n=1 Tax=Pelagibius sp. TaxID=1931238 RepID=UPI00262A13A7|nr:glycosyl hydrolase 108 family protein [Pelagibius sp.]